MQLKNTIGMLLHWILKIGTPVGRPLSNMQEQFLEASGVAIGPLYGSYTPSYETAGSGDLPVDVNYFKPLTWDCIAL